MRRPTLLAALLTSSLFGWNEQDELNVNSRYIVERVQVSGDRGQKLNSHLRSEIESVVGQRLNHQLLDGLAENIKKALRVQSVAIHVSRGSQPERVSVEFAIENRGSQVFDLEIPKGVYHSKQGWSGGVDGSAKFGKNQIGFGIISDGDTLTERYSGLRTKFERLAVGSDRIRMGLEFDAYHQQWNPTTLSAASTDNYAVYRNRYNIQPTVTFVLAEPLTLTVGASFQQMDNQLPAALTESANSVSNTLRFHRSWNDSASSKHDVEAGYSLRAATKMLGSDHAYTRHSVNIRYTMTHERHWVDLEFLAGLLSGGRAPLFERFALGNGSTLRGWNKFDLAALGGERVVHGSVEYRYRIFDVFYDTGAIWNRGGEPDQKQSVGCGIRTDGKDGLLVAVAFPLRQGRMDPMFVIGFNF